MKTIIFSFITSLFLSFSGFAQKSFTMTVNEKYTFTLKSGSQYSGVLLEIGDNYYIIENKDNPNKKIKILKKDIRSISFHNSKRTTNSNKDTFNIHKDYVRLYFGIGAGLTFLNPKLGFQMNTGIKLSKLSNIEATMFTYPKTSSSNDGFGINYNISNESFGIVLGMGYMKYKELMIDFELTDLGIIKIPTIAIEKNQANSLYTKLGFLLNNRNKTWMVGLEYLNFNISADERAGMVALTVHKRFFVN